MIATTTIIILINSLRPAKLPLKVDPFLTKIAEQRCITAKTFSHDDFYSTYEPEIRYKYGKYGVTERYKYIGENLAVNFDTAGSTVKAWENSPTHKEVMLSPKYKKIGVATCEKAPNVWFTVTHFGGN